MNRQKCKALVLLVIILLSLLHFGVATQGYMYYKGLPASPSGVNYEFNNFFPFFLAIIIGGGLQFILTFILMVQLYYSFWTSYGRYVLASLDLMITFTLSVVVSWLASKVTIMRGSIASSGKVIDDQFQFLYQLCITDATLTFAVEFLYLLILYSSTFEDYAYDNKVVKTIKLRKSKTPKKEMKGERPRLQFLKRKY